LFIKEGTDNSMQILTF